MDQMDLVSVVLIKSSLPWDLKDSPSSHGWKGRSHSPCYQEACHLACRSTNSFYTRGAIVHLNIDFGWDTIARIPESDSLTEAKWFHLLYYETTPPPHKLHPNLMVKCCTDMKGFVFFHLLQIPDNRPVEKKQKTTILAHLRPPMCLRVRKEQYFTSVIPAHILYFLYSQKCTIQWHWALNLWG